MAKEELGKLSPEQLKKLAKTISAAKNLTTQQAEIIEKVLAGEEDIGKLRIAYLEQYFDIYSRKLDLIARKHSALNDTFLVLDSKLTENYKELSSDVGKLVKQLEKVSKAAVGSGNTDSSNKAGKQTGDAANKELSSMAKDVRSILQVLRSGVRLDKEQYQTLLARTAEILTSASASITSTSAPVQHSADSTSVEANSSEGFQETVRGALDIINTMYDRSIPVPTTTSYESDRVSDLIAATGEPLPEKPGVTAEQPPAAPQVAPKELEPLQTDSDNDSGQEANSEGLKKTRQDILNFLDEIAKDGIAVYTQEAEVKARQAEQNKKLLEKWAKKEEAIRASMLDLAIAKLQTQEELEKRSIEVRLARLQEAIDAELELQNKLNSFASEIAFASTEEGANLRASEVNSKEELAIAEHIAEERAKFVADAELRARRKNNGKLTAEDELRIQQLANKKYKLDKENLDKLQKEQNKKAKKENKKETNKKNSADTHKAVTGPLSAEENLGKRFSDLGKVTKNKVHQEDPEATAIGKVMATTVAAIDTAFVAISDLAKQLNKKIDTIASYQGGIDTRLQGSKDNKTNYAGSYWGQLTKDMMSVGAVTPFFKQEDFANNIKGLVSKGISFDLKQRAFLMTIQEKIANTFNVADGTLLRLIRIQQEDSTAGRLGMESALNSFLNEMYETSEYLTDVAAQVRGSLQEMEALMSGAAATEVEYQVQKWMGSLYSVGMSQNAVTAISNALGQIASGQIDALASGGVGSLLVMAASNAGQSIADILSEGLDAENANSLLQATVNYLAEIAESTKGNNVVQQQLASAFGVKASDLRAAINLKSSPKDGKNSIGDISNVSLTYDNMLKQLNDMAGSMWKRTSIGEMMTNVWENAQYSMASSMANNPIAYLLYKMAGLLEDTTGGIDLPFINVMGFGVDLNTTVADLMRVASMAGGVLGSIGPMVKGLVSSFNGQKMLSRMGIEQGSGLTVTPRGGNGSDDPGIVDGGLDGGGAPSLSESGTVGNGNGSDVKDSTLQESNDSKKKQMIKAKEEEPANKVDVLNTTVIKIYELLDGVARGEKSFRVKIDSYGLTGVSSSSDLLDNSVAGGGLTHTGSGSSTAGTTIGGSFGNSSGSSFDGSFDSSSGSISGSSGSKGAIDLGGWTMF
jgi:hypothetical protein